MTKISAQMREAAEWGKPIVEGADRSELLRRGANEIDRLIDLLNTIDKIIENSGRLTAADTEQIKLIAKQRNLQIPPPAAEITD